MYTKKDFLYRKSCNTTCGKLVEKLQNFVENSAKCLNHHAINETTCAG